MNKSQMLIFLKVLIVKWLFAYKVCNATTVNYVYHKWLDWFYSNQVYDGGVDGLLALALKNKIMNIVLR
jgi:hypothetical protein